MPRLHDLRHSPSRAVAPPQSLLGPRRSRQQPFFKQALDLGINFFDTANIYSTGSSEKFLARFLKSDTKREDTVIATKLNGVMRDGPNGKGLSRKEIFFELDQSLKRLQIDCVDIPTKSIVGTTRRPSKKPWKLFMMW